MTRWVATIGCLLTALAFAMPVANEAKADGMKRAVSSHKRCVAPAMRWRTQTTWSCKVAEKCCYDWLLRRGSCATDRCF